MIFFVFFVIFLGSEARVLSDFWNRKLANSSNRELIYVILTRFYTQKTS